MARIVRIVHGPDVAAGAPRVHRLATRAVVRRGDALLLLRSRRGDLRFPGGGIDAGESVEQALRRELAEECGASLLAVGAHLLTVVDERPAREPGAVFAHLSRYYACEVAADLGDVEHDLRERTLALVPEWVPIGAALQVNRALRAERATSLEPRRQPRPDTAEDPDDLAWIGRETVALEVVAGEHAWTDEPFDLVRV